MCGIQREADKYTFLSLAQIHIFIINVRKSCNVILNLTYFAFNKRKKIVKSCISVLVFRFFLILFIKHLEIEKQIVHDHYDLNSKIWNDIALLRVKEKINFAFRKYFIRNGNNSYVLLIYFFSEMKNFTFRKCCSHMSTCIQRTH